MSDRLRQSVDVSVVIPCYRCGKTVARAVSSVMGQTVRPREILLVDDASPDDTLAVLEDLQSRYGDGIIRIARRERNGGPGEARNTAWEMATGRYLAFLDADDSWEAEKLARQWAVMEANPGAVLSGHPMRTASPGQAGAAPVSNPDPPTVRMLSRRDWLIRNCLPTSSVMIRRDAPERFLPGERFSEDYSLWLRLVFSGLPSARLEDRLGRHYKPVYGAGGQSGHLWAMERAELRNYRTLARRRQIGPVTFGLCAVWSLAKYTRRWVITRLYIS